VSSDVVAAYKRTYADALQRAAIIEDHFPKVPPLQTLFSRYPRFLYMPKVSSSTANPVHPSCGTAEPISSSGSANVGSEVGANGTVGSLGVPNKVVQVRSGSLGPTLDFIFKNGPTRDALLSMLPPADYVSLRDVDRGTRAGLKAIDALAHASHPSEKRLFAQAEKNADRRILDTVALEIGEYLDEWGVFSEQAFSLRVLLPKSNDRASETLDFFQTLNRQLPKYLRPRPPGPGADTKFVFLPSQPNLLVCDEIELSDVLKITEMMFHSRMKTHPAWGMNTSQEAVHECPKDLNSFREKLAYECIKKVLDRVESDPASEVWGGQIEGLRDHYARLFDVAATSHAHCCTGTTM
jgi:hypothetical protein